MSRLLFIAAFILGASAIVWTSSIFIGTDILALLVTLIIGLAYGIGFVELSKYRHATDSLNSALEELRDDITELGAWLGKAFPPLVSEDVLKRGAFFILLLMGVWICFSALQPLPA